MSEVMGIDVSHYQRSINWKKVTASGKKFVVMKAMYEAKSHRIDETFEYNYKESGSHGLARGVYIFVGSASIANPQNDARSFLRILADRPLEYGIWLDYESASLRAMGKEKIKKLTKIYADIFRESGYYVGIYCNKDWYDNVIHPDLKKDFDFWIARYPKNDTGSYCPTSKLRPSKNEAAAWQYSSKGRIDGIDTFVDLDVDYDGIVNLLAASPYRKTNEEIAREVIAGLWGTKSTKPTRRELLTRAGYDYDKIQNLVNLYLKK